MVLNIVVSGWVTIQSSLNAVERLHKGIKIKRVVPNLWNDLSLRAPKRKGIKFNWDLYCNRKTRMVACSFNLLGLLDHICLETHYWFIFTHIRWFGVHSWTMNLARFIYHSNVARGNYCIWAFLSSNTKLDPQLTSNDLN